MYSGMAALRSLSSYVAKRVDRTVGALEGPANRALCPGSRAAVPNLGTVAAAWPAAGSVGGGELPGQAEPRGLAGGGAARPDAHLGEHRHTWGSTVRSEITRG